MIHSARVIGPISASLRRAAVAASGVSRTSGGYTRYNRSGTTSRLARPGTRAAIAQPTQVTPRSAAICAASGLAAIAVRNIALVTRLPWNELWIRNAPTRRSVPSAGRLSCASATDRTIGWITAPARAVMLGMSGASTRSVAIML